jgi:hypothetical protein
LYFGNFDDKIKNKIIFIIFEKEFKINKKKFIKINILIDNNY